MSSTEQKSFFSRPSTPDTPDGSSDLILAYAAAETTITLSSPMAVDLAVYRGDSGTFRITVTNPDQSPYDISAATWDADIRVTASSTEVITNFDIVPVVGDVSSIDVHLSAENSALLPETCVYDIEMTIGDLVSTLINGNIAVTEDVSRT